MRWLLLIVVAATMAAFVPAPALAQSSAKATTRPVGSPALADAAAARRVDRSGWEPRRANRAANRTVPTRRQLRNFRQRSSMTYKRRVTGRFHGTTDEIIQWAAHKHGVDEDVMRAVAVVESWWRMSTVGDNGDSFGLYQLRRPWHCCVALAKGSTAFNADYYGAIIRAYYDGREIWLRHDRGSARYSAGDLWGSVGAWYAGQWHTAAAERYVTKVKAVLADRVWRSRHFAGGR